MQVKRKNPAGSPSPQRAQGRRSSDPSNPAKPAESFAGFCRARTLGHFQAASDVKTPCHMAATRASAAMTMTALNPHLCCFNIFNPHLLVHVCIVYLCQTVQSIHPSLFLQVTAPPPPPPHAPRHRPPSPVVPRSCCAAAAAAATSSASPGATSRSPAPRPGASGLESFSES